MCSVSRISRAVSATARAGILGTSDAKSSIVVWSGGTAAYHSDVPVSRRWMRTPPFPCAIRITRSAPSYSWRRIDLRRWSFARPAFVTRPTTSRSPTVRRIARIDRWNSWWASPTSTSSSRNIVGRHARTARPAAVSSIFLSSMSNINVVIWWHVRSGHVDPRQDFLSRQGDPLPEGDHAVRVHGIPAVEEDDLVALHDRADGQEGRQVEHEVGAAVDQRDLARLERTEDPIEGRHEGREARTGLDADLRDDDGFRGERDGNLPLDSMAMAI